jgi:hypothetical protein
VDPLSFSVCHFPKVASRRGAMVSSNVMEEEGADEWEVPTESEGVSIAPEDHDRFRGLLTELAFSVAGAPLFAISALWIQPPLRYSPGSGLAAPAPDLWQTALYQWLPLLMGVLAFGCLVWLVAILIRLSAMQRSKAGG